jgi:hypothetical protein
MLISRRSFFGGLASAIAAPAIVRATSIMPVRGLVLPLYPEVTMGEYRGVIIREVEHLRARRVPPYRAPDGTDYYLAIVPPNNWRALIAG